MHVTMYMIPKSCLFHFETQMLLPNLRRVATHPAIEQAKSYIIIVMAMSTFLDYTRGVL